LDYLGKRGYKIVNPTDVVILPCMMGLDPQILTDMQKIVKNYHSEDKDE